ncbi:MAG: trimeric intracellular cation channel family protein [Xenococcaceae cyanobacterium]
MFSVIYYLDLFGVAIFAIRGALVAEQQQLNILGILVSAILTAVGGRTVRDMVLGETSIFWIQDPVYLIIAAIAGFIVFVVAPYYRFRGRVFLLADAIALAVFTIIGIQKAIFIGVPLFNAVLLGTLTGVGGGAIRDMLLGCIYRKEREQAKKLENSIWFSEMSRVKLLFKLINSLKGN